MSDKWTLYHQTGPDGLEWGIRVRPGYIVTGFSREDAEAVVRWQNASCRPASDILERAKSLMVDLSAPYEIKEEGPGHWIIEAKYKDLAIALMPELIAEVERLRDIIDRPPEEAEWMTDYHLLYSALDGPIIDAARKWHAAYRKAQNSNLMREKEVKRLRSVAEARLQLNWTLSGECNELMQEIATKNASIKELEAQRGRLEAAFLKPETIDLLMSIVGAGATTSRSVKKIEQADMWDAVYNELQKAREKLEKIRNGAKG